jgi:hypothetical protein
MKAKKDGILVDKISWPSPDYGDAVFKKAIHELKESCKPIPRKEWWMPLGIVESYSSQEQFPPVPVSFEDPAFQSKIITAIYDQIHNLERDYEYRSRTIKNGPEVIFDKNRSVLFYKEEIVPIPPNTNQGYLCKFMFENYPNGEFIENETILSKGFGEDPEEVGSQRVKTAAIEINKKTNKVFGFSIFSTPIGQISLNRTQTRPK